ncbi:MAG: hypothetical protein IJ777_02975 [Clostridia bacterium]|nr:hypothetical protein [Clostridia bacterium]
MRYLRKQKEAKYSSNKRNEKGITLIALIVTIIILLILAGVTINAVFGEHGIIKRGEEAQETTTVASEDEAIRLALISCKATGESVTARQLEEELKNSNNSVTVISYNDNLYATFTDTNHIYEIDKAGNITSVSAIANIEFDEASLYKINLPAWKPWEALRGYIPIYTVEQYQKICSEVQDYEIKDLNNISKGKFNMNKNANYVLMNDLDFKGRSISPIPDFKGIFEGNGRTIKNLNINTKTYGSDGMIADATDAKVQNLLIQDSICNGDGATGMLIGRAINTTVENCYVKDCTIKSEYGVGGLVGLATEKGITIKGCKNINSKMGGVIASGILGHSLGGTVNIEDCSVISAEQPLELTGGIVSEINIEKSKDNDNINIKNCKVKNIKLTSSADKKREEFLDLL